MNKNRPSELPSDLPLPILPHRPEWVNLCRFAWEQAAAHIRVSRGRRHMDAAWDPQRNYQWVWDTCFMALYCRYAPEFYPGVESLDNFYELQRDDGYISMTYNMDTGEEPWPDRINPPLFAWVEWEHYRTTGDASRFSRVIPHIERLMSWIEANRRTKPHRRRQARDNAPDGRGESKQNYQLYYFTDCGSSGMDDSPRTPREHEAGQFFDWIDLSAQMALSYSLLSAMYNVLENPDAAGKMAECAKKIGQLINEELWCPRTRFYHDRSLPQNWVGHKTIAGFWPMIAGICPPERVEHLVDHLLDKKTFFRPIPIPSLSADDPNYCEKGTYWVGGVWAPTNYMTIRGLFHAGRKDVAHTLAERYMDGLSRTFAEFSPSTLWECNSPEFPQPGKSAYLGETVRPDFVGWTGLGPIAMLIENILGFDVQMAQQRVVWDIRLTEEHGIKNLRLGTDGRGEFLCAERPAAQAPAQLRIHCSVPVTLEAHCHGRIIEYALNAGETHELEV